MDVAEQLQQLAEMHRRGELTDAEFAMAKQATLSASTAPSTPGSSAQLPPFQHWPNNFKKDAQESVSVWKRYRLVIALFCVTIFIIVAVLMFGLFMSANSLLKTAPQDLGAGNLPGQ
jgi:hypothetical protein